MSGVLWLLALFFLPRGLVRAGNLYSDWDLSSPLCSGVVSFELQTSTPIDTLESNVDAFYSLVPLWASTECRVAIRSIECVSNYAPYNGTYLCYDECEALLQGCSSVRYGDANVLAATGASLLESLCTGKPSSKCAAVGSAIVIDRDYPVCVGPALVVPNAASLSSVREDGSTITYLTGTGCAISCPDPMYTSQEYTARKIACIMLSIVAIISSALCVRKHWKPFKLLVVLFAGTCLGLSLTTLVEVLANWADTLYCRGNSANFNRAPTCVALSAVMYWFLDCAHAVGMLQAFHLWISTTRIRKTRNHMMKWYLGIAISLPSLFVVVAVATRQLGANVSTNAPNGGVIFCVMGYEDHRIGIFWYWLLFFTPSILEVFSCAVFLVLFLRYTFNLSKNVAGHKHNVNRVQSDTISRDTCWLRLGQVRLQLSNWCSIFLKIVRRQQRAIRFLCLLCISTLTIFGFFAAIYGVELNRFYDAEKAWLDCLLIASAFKTDSSAAYKTCGSVPSFRLSPWILGYIEAYNAALGLVPALIFGVFMSDEKREPDVIITARNNIACISDQPKKNSQLQLGLQAVKTHHISAVFDTVSPPFPNSPLIQQASTQAVRIRRNSHHLLKKRDGEQALVIRVDATVSGEACHFKASGESPDASDRVQIWTGYGSEHGADTEALSSVVYEQSPMAKNATQQETNLKEAVFHEVNLHVSRS